MRELKPGMKVRVESFNALVQQVGAETVMVDCGFPSMRYTVPKSQCKPVLPEIGVGDMVRHDVGDQGIVVNYDGVDFTVVPDEITRTERWLPRNVTLVRKASYSDVTDE